MWIPDGSRKPDFTQLEKVLRREKPDRAVLWEFYLNDPLYAVLCEGAELPADPYLNTLVRNITAYSRAGYDYAMLTVVPDFSFDIQERYDIVRDSDVKSVSMSHGGVIGSWDDFENFPWPDIDSLDLSALDKVSKYIPEGMKLIPNGPGGVEENIISLMGYESLCFAMIDNPDLVSAVFDKVGDLLVKYYRLVTDYPFVGACMSNDDWGFNTQPLLSPQQMEKYLYPWHRKIVNVIHAAGIPALLHSCGNLYPDIMDTIIDDLGYDAKHSYEDGIKPVEEVYEEYSDRIAILGGIDLDYMIKATPQEVYERSVNLLKLSADRGAFALGTGNSVPDYVPNEAYFAMIKAAWDYGADNVGHGQS